MKGKFKFSFLVGAAAIAMLVFFTAGAANAYKFKTGMDWDVTLDNSLMYTIGWRAEKIDEQIGNDPFHAMGEYKFKDRGDLVTNRIQDLIELQVVYKKDMGFRTSGSLWKDFAYNDDVETNPGEFATGLPYSAFLSYPSGKYSSYTEKYHVQGGELLDAFLFYNTRVGDIPVYFKAGRLTQYWGNAFFFGFSNIAYSQHPVDYIKGFSQPGSEVRELFLPRTQLLVAADLTPKLSIAAQYFLEYRHNRYPEAGTFLSAFDILYSGPETAGLVGLPIGSPDEPSDTHSNFGVKVAWSPDWADGDLGFYYRQFDDVHPWAGFAGDFSDLHLAYAQDTKLYGLSYQRVFGPISTAFEVSYRKDTALSTIFAPYINGKGATGDIINVIANILTPLPTIPLWDTGVFIGEVTYTHLDSVTGNESLYNGVGYPGGSSREEGSATDDAIAFAMLFDPQWLQVLPGVDFNLPVSLTWGISGNPAYAAGGFYGEGTLLYSFGVKATYHSRHSVLLQYNSYHWDTHTSTVTPSGLPYYATGNGAWGLNDKGWIQLQFKTSF